MTQSVLLRKHGCLYNKLRLITGKPRFEMYNVMTFVLLVHQRHDSACKVSFRKQTLHIGYSYLLSNLIVQAVIVGHKCVIPWRRYISQALPPPLTKSQALRHCYIASVNLELLLDMLPNCPKLRTNLNLPFFRELTRNPSSSYSHTAPATPDTLHTV